ncbi:MAG: hypothetical protein M3032_00115 [Verrucomicrobiota bacterium]|nr:hypothetical protein [Verrucomicrobiota bacterium]
MILYDVLHEGVDGPVTREQIEELYHAGRVKRDDRCKLMAKREWRTIDEHFPLLKHAGPRLAGDETQQRARLNRWLFGSVIIAATAALFALILVAAARTDESQVTSPASRKSPRMRSAALSRPQFQYSIQPTVPPYTRATSQPSTAQSTPPAQISALPSASDSILAERNRQEADGKRLEQERLAREQAQRQQAASADQLRAQKQQQEDARRREAGTDTIVPLDTYYPVTVGASIVTVKVHDNNVSSFDIWINGRINLDKLRQLHAPPRDSALTGALLLRRLRIRPDSSGDEDLGWGCAAWERVLKVPRLWS